ncbi:unnamed protein product [Choristocarpus tenellus]
MFRDWQGDLSRDMIMCRTGGANHTYADLFPTVESESLLQGTAPPALQAIWSQGEARLKKCGGKLCV